MSENLTPNTRDNYLPSSAEKKQAVMMYLFVGLLLSLQQQDVSPYMHHHIKQSMGWIVLLVLIIFLDVILFIFGLLFGKFFSILGGIITIPVLILGILCIKQAYDGKYQRDTNGATKFFSGFAGLGSWVLNLFDADHYQSKIGLENPQQIPTNSSSPEIDLTQYEIGKQ
ncbi:MAG: hypothetical protein LBO09_06830 [Candidatus Peribacteria bacterium]|jgi:hypothetical protein|nr:hypothetical protein [Candidatus Peribacteria bacterium]